MNEGLYKKVEDLYKSKVDTITIDISNNSDIVDEEKNELKKFIDKEDFEKLCDVMEDNGIFNVLNDFEIDPSLFLTDVVLDINTSHISKVKKDIYDEEISDEEFAKRIVLESEDKNHSKTYEEAIVDQIISYDITEGSYKGSIRNMLSNNNYYYADEDENFNDSKSI